MHDSVPGMLLSDCLEPDLSRTSILYCSDIFTTGLEHNN
jgi:hypothetical protein